MPNPDEVVARRERRGGLALCLQGRYTHLQRLHFLVKLAEAIRAGRLGQPSGLEGPQIPVDGRASLSKGCSCAGQFGLAARVLSMPSLLRALGGLFKEGAIIQCGQSLSEHCLLQRLRG